ncbi:MAG: aminobenzoyl-glutamate utilization protein B, partial [Algoriphagus sp.]
MTKTNCPNLRNCHKAILFSILFLGFSSLSFSQKTAKSNPLKDKVQQSVDTRYVALTDLSDKIWSFEEIAFQETQSAAALSDYA